MTVEWKIPEGPFKRLYEVEEFKNAVEPVDLYNERYARDTSLLSAPEIDDPHRYMDEVFSYFDYNSSILIFGAGHSYNVNEFSKDRHVKSIASWDFAESAVIGLNEGIRFYNDDILNCDIKNTLDSKYDYIFTSYTLEHFTEKELLFNIIPKLIFSVNKALAIVVPYADNWAGEPTHKCRFYENDEFALICDRYKIIRDGVEIVYWIDVV